MLAFYQYFTYNILRIRRIDFQFISVHTLAAAAEWLVVPVFIRNKRGTFGHSITNVKREFDFAKQFFNFRIQSGTANDKIYQVSTLQALALGYTRQVVTVRALLEQGDTGLGTFENVDGEMIVLDGVCYQAKQDGSVVTAEDTAGVPFAVAGCVKDGRKWTELRYSCQEKRHLIHTR